MKRMSKKLVSLMLALVMTLSMAMSVCAAENTGKTVNVVFMVDSSANLTNPPAQVKVDNVKLAADATVKDAIDKAAVDENGNERVSVKWAEDTVSKPNGWYITSFMGLTSQYIDSGKTDEGENYYKSNSTIIYQIPTGTSLNVTADTEDNPQAIKLYASNVQAVDGDTIYVVYQYTYTTWVED